MRKEYVIDESMLRDCPFCGGKPKLYTDRQCFGHGEFYLVGCITCEDCGARTADVVLDGLFPVPVDDLRFMWNGRY